jgi:hypothetical protein
MRVGNPKLVVKPGTGRTGKLAMVAYQFQHCGLGARNIKLSTNSVAVNTVSSHVAGYESMYFSACAAAGSKLVEAAEAIVSQLCDGNYVKSPMLLWERLVIGFVIMRWHFSLHLLGDIISFSC